MAARETEVSWDLLQLFCGEHPIANVRITHALGGSTFWAATEPHRATRRIFCQSTLHMYAIER